MKEVKNIKHILTQHKEEIQSNFKVKELGVFGSFVRNEQREESDVDILVEFSEPVGMFHFLDLEEYLATLLATKVDLVSNKALKPFIKDYVLNEVQYV